VAAHELFQAQHARKGWGCTTVSEDQQADSSFLTYIRAPIASWDGTHWLKKREAPAEDQQADSSFMSNYIAPITSWGRWG